MIEIIKLCLGNPDNFSFLFFFFQREKKKKFLIKIMEH